MCQWSVVIPFHDEAPNCRAVLDELREVVDREGVAVEVIAVDDGSSDGTLEALRAVEERWPVVRIVSLQKNHGQAAALLVGMRLARAPIVVTMDGDGQNVPADIPRLIEGLSEADMVVGVRRRRIDSPLRRAMSRVANGVRRRLLRDDMHDSGCAMRAFRREVTTSFLPLRTLYSFMPALAVAAGFRVAERDVGHRARRAGKSHYGLRAMSWRPAVDMVGLWWWRRRRVQLPAILRDSE